MLKLIKAALSRLAKLAIGAWFFLLCTMPLWVLLAFFVPFDGGDDSPPVVQTPAVVVDPEPADGLDYQP